MKNFKTKLTRDEINDAHDHLDDLAEIGYAARAGIIRAALPPRPLTYEELEAENMKLRQQLEDDTSPTSPAPLPAPQDAKEDEIYLVSINSCSGPWPAERMPSYPGDANPWVITKFTKAFSDSEITILARLIPDRPVEA